MVIAQWLALGLLVLSNDPVTAKLKSAFQSAGFTGASLDALASPPRWSCTYHASNDAVLFDDARDVAYDATFVRQGFLIEETATGVHAGPRPFPGWSHWLAAAGNGLQFDADGEQDLSEAIRMTPDGSAVVEFLFQPLGFFDPSNVSVTDPSRNTAGFALCTAN